MFTTHDLEAACTQVYRHMSPTPQINWPLLSEQVEVETWVKHENHTPTGAFKIRGGITYLDWLCKTQPELTGIVSATRGNHGQSLARAAAANGIRARIFVPHGNSTEKNAAMRAFGAELIETGDDFEAAVAAATQAGSEPGWHFVPSFHRELVRGVATYAYEFFSNTPVLDAVYVPIGLGSGICGVIAARDALGLSTEVIAVVAGGAPAAMQSVEAGHIITGNRAVTFADGMAVRAPNPQAFEIYRNGAARFVSVSDDQIADAARLIFATTHNTAEGSGAAALAALLNERAQMQGKRAGVILTGGNIDTPQFATLLSGQTPQCA